MPDRDPPERNKRCNDPYINALSESLPDSLAAGQVGLLAWRALEDALGLTSSGSGPPRVLSGRSRVCPARTAALVGRDETGDCDTFWRKSLQWHLRGLESTVGAGAEARERAIGERPDNRGKDDRTDRRSTAQAIQPVPPSTRRACRATLDGPAVPGSVLRGARHPGVVGFLLAVDRGGARLPAVGIRVGRKCVPVARDHLPRRGEPKAWRGWTTGRPGGCEAGRSGQASLTCRYSCESAFWPICNSTSLERPCRLSTRLLRRARRGGWENPATPDGSFDNNVHKRRTSPDDPFRTRRGRTA
jgi:hypothetical protein